MEVSKVRLMWNSRRAEVSKVVVFTEKITKLGFFRNINLKVRVTREKDGNYTLKLRVKSLLLQKKSSHFYRNSAKKIPLDSCHILLIINKHKV